MLDGTAGPGLLDTYDTERRPVGSFTVEQAYTRYVLRLDPSLGKDDLMPIVDEAAVEPGYRQLSGAVRVEDGDDGALWEDPREPTARPGMRAPHLPVDRDGKVVQQYGTGAKQATARTWPDRDLSNRKFKKDDFVLRPDQVHLPDVGNQQHVSPDVLDVIAQLPLSQPICGEGIDVAEDIAEAVVVS